MVDSTILRRRIILSVMLIFNAAQAWAQLLPGGAEPGRFEERVNIPPLKQQDKILAPLPAAQEASMPSEAETGVVLTAVNIQGSTVFSQAELHAVYGEYLGQRMDLAGLRQIAGRITQYYREHGYFLCKAFLPVQDIVGGKIQIIVVEGYVAKVDVRADTPDILSKDIFSIISGMQADILATKPLHAGKLERQLLLLNDLAGIRAEAVMEPLPEADAPPGAVGMALRFSRTAPQYSISADNFGSRFSGPYQATATVQFSPRMAGFDELTLAALASLPADELKYGSAGYAVALNPHGTRLNVRGEYSQSQPGYNLEIFDIESRYASLAAGIHQSLIHSRTTHLAADISLDARNVSTDILNTELYRDRIRSVNFSADFIHADMLAGTSQASVTLSRGLDILGARDNGAQNLSRAAGRNDYTKIEATASRLQQLAYGWEALAAATGQIASSPLLSSEEFGYGGQNFGRGYDPSELLGDSGIAGMLELRYTALPEWRSFYLQPFAFGDIGKVWNRDPGAMPENSGASAGFGMRLTHVSGANGMIYAAFPLTREAEAPPSGNGHAARLLLQGGYRF